MAGFIFAVSQDGWDAFCAENLAKGFFTPYTKPMTEEDMTSRKRRGGNKTKVAIFGDIISMHHGDNIYFLSNRKLYGIGEAKQIGADCKYDNYLNASALLPDWQIAPTDYLMTPETRARWGFFFKPSPFFFKKGVDMDDVLRYRPQAFKVLRAFEGLTFIKIDDEENRALKEYISLVNEPSYDHRIEESVFAFDDTAHKRYASTDLSPYRMDINKALFCSDNRAHIISEMFLESALLQEVSRGNVRLIGSWDYLTHQLIASPFKPLRYIDKIDIFGYRFSKHYLGEPKLITKYLLIELKVGKINCDALKQTMQYVDWICNEYASGDYSKIEAYVIGEGKARDICGCETIKDICQRSFIAETHPVKSEKWCDLRLIKYTIEENVRFELLEV